MREAATWWMHYIVRVTSLGKRGLVALLLPAIVGFAACGNDSVQNESNEQAPILLTAASLGEQSVLPANEILAAPPYQNADIDNGSRLAQVCRACHSLDKGGPQMIGPPLHGFFGRAAATVEGFDYSAAMHEVEFVWTPRALDAWLMQPGRFLPGNRMTFAGVPKEQDRNDLIAYLLQTTAE